MKQQGIDIYQTSIASPVSFIGRGLHTGVNVSVTVKPADAGTGIVFRRTDMSSGSLTIPARWYNVLDTDHGTTIGLDSANKVQTVEHLMSALFGLGIDNVEIEVDGTEVPAMDGSAESFVSLFSRVGIVSQEVLKSAMVIHREIEFSIGNSHARILPSHEPIIKTNIDFSEPLIGQQSLTSVLTPDNYTKQIASARTFATDHAVAALHKRGLAKGASVRNGIYIRQSNVMNPGGLRYKNEFVRHKALDFIGDMALAGNIIFGRIIVSRPGHGFNNRLMHHLFSLVDHWSYDLIKNISNEVECVESRVC